MGLLDYILGRDKKYREQIAWCLSNDDHDRSGFSLAIWLHNLTIYSRNKEKWVYQFPRTQCMISISPHLSIHIETEKESINSILQQYQSHLSNDYINNKVFFVTPIPSHKLTNGEFFIITLMNYLESHESTCVLSPDALAFYKLLYICQAYERAFSENPKDTSKLGYIQMEHTKQQIESLTE